MLFGKGRIMEAQGIRNGPCKSGLPASVSMRLGSGSSIRRFRSRARSSGRTSTERDSRTQSRGPIHSALPLIPRGSAHDEVSRARSCFAPDGHYRTRSLIKIALHSANRLIEDRLCRNQSESHPSPGFSGRCHGCGGMIVYYATPDHEPAPTFDRSSEDAVHRPGPNPSREPAHNQEKTGPSRLSEAVRSPSFPSGAPDRHTGQPPRTAGGARLHVVTSHVLCGRCEWIRVARLRHKTDFWA